MRKNIKDFHASLNTFFNNLFNYNNNSVLKYERKIELQEKLVCALKELNDEDNNELIENKIKRIALLKNRMYQFKSRNSRYLKYSMTEQELNLLMQTINKELAKNILLGKNYYFPKYLGKLMYQKKNISKITKSVNWEKSINNLHEIIKVKDIDLYNKFKTKVITRGEYFKLAKEHLDNKNFWLEYRDVSTWGYLVWIPNFKYMFSLDVQYYFKFTKYNNITFLKNSKTQTILEYLNTPDKILNCDKIGNINKCIFLQLQNK